MNRSGSLNPRATNRPMSSTAISWRPLSTGTDTRTPPPRIPSRWNRKFSMNDTGRQIVAGRPSARMCSSMRHLLSKCGIPVARSAPPTEVYVKWETPAPAAASASADPRPLLGLHAARVAPVLHAEHPVRALDGVRQRCGIVEVRLDQLGPQRGQRAGRGLGRVPRHRPHGPAVARAGCLAAAPPCRPVAPVTRIVRPAFSPIGSPPIRAGPTRSHTRAAACGRRDGGARASGPRRAKTRE